MRLAAKLRPLCRRRPVRSRGAAFSTAESSVTQPSEDEGPSVLIECRRIDPSAQSQSEVYIVTLNRPKQYNVLTLETLGELQTALDEIAEHRNVRAVVLRGSGKAFSTGHDLRQIRESQGDKEYLQALFARCSRFMYSIQRVKQPVIAAVNGLATGAGTQLVAACDLAVAASSARFATSGVNLGLFCATPSVPLSRNISRKRSFEMLVTGEFIDAEKAQDWGLVNRVVEPEKLDEAVMELVKTIASKPAVAVETGKRFFYEQIERSLPVAYDLADWTMTNNLMHCDAKEGIEAFTEKRPPKWGL